MPASSFRTARVTRVAISRYSGIPFVEVERHRLVGLVLADQRRDAGHRGHDLVLRVAKALDRLPLLGAPRRPPGARRCRGSVLFSRNMLWIVASSRKSRALRVKLICRPRACSICRVASTRSRAWSSRRLWWATRRDRSEAHGPHRDQEQRDEQERPEQLRVDRGAEARDAPHQWAQGPVGQQETRDSLGQAGRRFRDRTAGSDAALALVRTHAACSGDPAGCYQARHRRSMRRPRFLTRPAPQPIIARVLASGRAGSRTGALARSQGRERQHDHRSGTERSERHLAARALQGRRGGRDDGASHSPRWSAPRRRSSGASRPPGNRERRATSSSRSSART